MSTIDIRGTGMEAIGRAVLLLLIDNVNVELTAQESAWAAEDAELYALLGHGPQSVPLERFATKNMHLGHIPSLIDAPVYAYPNLAVMVDGSGTGNSDPTLDHAWNRVDTLFVELMLKAGPYDRDDVSGEGEDLLNRRVQRTVDAVVNVLAEHRTLEGLVQEIPDQVAARISDVFVRYENDDGTGPKFFWQAARLDYSIPKTQRAY